MYRKRVSVDAFFEPDKLFHPFVKSNKVIFVVPKGTSAPHMELEAVASELSAATSVASGAALALDEAAEVSLVGNIVFLPEARNIPPPTWLGLASFRARLASWNVLGGGGAEEDGASGCGVEGVGAGDGEGGDATFGGTCSFGGLGLGEG